MVKRAADLAELLRPVRCLLLDFDGPVCSVFAGLPSRVVAARVRDAVERAGGDVGLDEATERDPIEVFRRTAGLPPDIVAAADEALRAAELEAVRAARPTTGADELLDTCAQVGVTVVIVSNNSSEAIREYLGVCQLLHAVAHVVGRDEQRPELLKPDPYLVHAALRVLGAEPKECVLLGDSVSDVSAARAAAVPAIGFANKDGKERQLEDADAAVVVSSIADVTAALRLRTASS